MLILNAAEVQRSLPMPEAIAAMKQAFAAFSSGQAVVPARIHLTVPQHAGICLVMPALVSGADAGREALAVKVVSVFDRNSEFGLARIQAAVLVIDTVTGRPQALLEGATLTAIRTAAASGAATDLLSRPESHVAAILGAGVQARTHLEAMLAVRDISEIRIYSRTRSRVDNLIREVASRSEYSGVRFISTDSPRQAIDHADIICATTTSKTPVFEDADVAAGTHMNAVGSYQPAVCEIPGETVARSRVFVDSRLAAWDEAGDLIQPLNTGLINREHISAELGELVLGQKLGRTDDRQITLFKSVGLAVQDAVAEHVAVENARRLQFGTEIDW